MESLTTGRPAGEGALRCSDCGLAVAPAAQGAVPACPRCGSTRVTRASLFTQTRFGRPAAPSPDPELAAVVAEARDRMPGPGPALAWRADGGLHVVPLEKEWTRIGRSLAADVRFDDPTVSRRHALLIRQADGVRVLDDRSLNGVFVNGSRVEWHTLRDGDEILVGRYRLVYLEPAQRPSATPGRTPEAG